MQSSPAHRQLRAWTAALADCFDRDLTNASREEVVALLVDIQVAQIIGRGLIRSLAARVAAADRAA